MLALDSALMTVYQHTETPENPVEGDLWVGPDVDLLDLAGLAVHVEPPPRKPFGFRVMTPESTNPPEDDDNQPNVFWLWEGGKYAVGLPHQCDSWVITSNADKYAAIRDMEAFVREASAALAKLVVLTSPNDGPVIGSEGFELTDFRVISAVRKDLLKEHSDCDCSDDCPYAKLTHGGIQSIVLLAQAYASGLLSLDDEVTAG